MLEPISGDEFKFINESSVLPQNYSAVQWRSNELANERVLLRLFAL